MQRAKNSDKYSALVAWLKDARINRNLTMRELGALLDEAHTIVAKVENGDRKLDVYEYVQYCQVLELNPSEGLGLLE